jgi:hypothetical protein
MADCLFTDDWSPFLLAILLLLLILHKTDQEQDQDREQEKVYKHSCHWQRRGEERALESSRME